MQFWRVQGHSWETDWENASTEIVGNPIFVGSEPNKLALSSDGLVLCVGPNGRTAVRPRNALPCRRLKHFRFNWRVTNSGWK